jgi:hypothetical protein
MIDFFELKQLVINAPIKFKTRQHIWQHYISMINPGDIALEFGVWYGTSINYMAMARPDNEFHGFDSFDGLPEDWIRGHPKGHFKVDKEKLKFAPNIKTHEGWFDQTLPVFLEECDKRDKIKFIHIDCDLGSSTECVLNLLKKEILGNRAILLFDEFYNYLGYEDHEFLAFLKFIQETCAQFEIIGRNVTHQQVMIAML